MDLKSKLNDFKKVQFFKEQKKLYENIYGSNFIDFILTENFVNPEINNVIAFIELNGKSSYCESNDKDYTLKPTYVLGFEDVTISRSDVASLKLELSQKIFKYFKDEVIYLSVSKGYNYGQILNGYLVLKKSFLLNNLETLSSNMGFFTNLTTTKFLYYYKNKPSTKIYVYFGEIQDDKFVKIIN